MSLRTIFKNYFLQKAFGQTSERILLTCFPKSGSTYTSNVIGNLENFSKIPLVSYGGRREQELDYFELLKVPPKKKFIAQHHVRSHQATLKLCKKFNIQVILLTRNIFDCVVSMRDHIRNESEIFPHAFITENQKTLNDETLEECIVDLLIPWYFNFYVTWMHTNEKLHVTYEEMKADEILYFEKILKYSGVQLGSDQIQKAIEITKSRNLNRLNVGAQGRGVKLSSYSQSRIIRLASYYPEIDFSSIGIQSHG